MNADYCDYCDYFDRDLVLVYDPVYHEWVWVCRGCARQVYGQ